MSDTYHKDLVDANLHKPGYVQSADPGAVGAGILWIDTTESVWIAKIRNDADDGWETINVNINGTPDLAAPAVADEILLSDTDDSNTVKKSDLDAILALYDSKTSTLTNKTFDANGTGNSLSNVETADIASGSKTGSDTNVVTGTAGSEDDLGLWNSDGDMTSITPSNINTNNLLLNGAFKYWYSGTSSAPDGWTGSRTLFSRESSTVKIGDYSCAIKWDGVVGYTNFSQTYTDQRLQGREVTFSMWVKAGVASKVKIGLYDDGTGGADTFSSYNSGTDWELLTVTKTLTSDYSTVYIKVQSEDDTNWAYLDGAMLVEGSIPFAYTEHKQDHLYEQSEINVSFLNCPTSGASGYYSTIATSEQYACPQAVNTYPQIPITALPTSEKGHNTVIDSATFYYNTQDNSTYIEMIKIYQNNGDGTQTELVNHTDDLGNGSSGDNSHNFIDSPITLSNDGDLYFRWYMTGGTNANDARFYSLKVLYHIDPSS